MSSIDQRVVSMKFDNAGFERGVRQTSKSLDELKKASELKGAKKGLAGLVAAGKNFSLGSIANGVQDISSRFTNLGILGVTALANIANKAVDTGLQLAKSLTIDPIMDGLREYETQLNSVQTILANTQSKGTNLDDVNGALDELNTYADKTIYNFSEMTRNIGTFTAAGVDLDTSTEAIKGIANLAALSGSNSQQASTAMYQLSQAMSSGTVRLMDWNSVVNAGMGGQVFQDALVETARNQGIQVDDFIKKNGSFRESLQEEWLTTEVMTETLSKFTGDLSSEQLKQMGYTDEQIKGIIEMGKTAQDAATKVKTASQLLDTLKEAVGSGWAQSFMLIFGDFEEAKELFTGVSDVLGGMIGASADARNELIGGWKDLGGRDAIIQSIANAFKALMAILEPIKAAFVDIFPPVTAQTLYEMSLALQEFTANLVIGEGTAGKIQRTFAGFFAVVGIGWEIVKGLAGMLLELFGVVQDGSGGFLDITANIGDFLVGLHKAVKEGDGLAKVFDVLGGVITVIMGVIGGAVKGIVALGKAIAGVFSGGKFDLDFGSLNPLEGILDKLAGRFGVFGDAISWAISAASSFLSAMGQVWNVLAKGDFVGGFFEEDSKVVDWLFKIRDGLVEFGTWLGDFFADFDFNTLLDVFNTGLFVGLFLLFKKFFGDITGLLSGEGGGLIGSITGIFDTLTGSLEAMQTNLKANTLIKIAGAIALLAAAVLLLSLIDSEDLTKALVAMTVMFTQLFLSMAVFEKATASAGFAKMPLVAASMILLAIAMNIMALAVKQLSGLDWEELAKGLLGVAGMLGLMAGYAAIMSKQNGSLIRASVAMILVGAALNIMASAVEKLSSLSWEELIKGLGAVGGLLLAVGLFGNLGGGTLKGALSLVVIGAGLTILAGVLERLSALDPDKMVTSLILLAAALAVLAGGMNLMNGALMGAASMLIVVAALWVLVPLLERMGEMTWNEIAKAATMLAGALLIIAGGMYLMTGIIAGAASMLVAVAALWVLIPLLERMGEMTWEEIGKAATMLAGSLLIIAGGLYLMTAALPGAAALIVVAFALQVMIPVLIALSQLTWNELLVGLAGLAGVFLVLGVSALVLAPVIPLIFLLGAAIAVLGVGILAAGAGFLAFSIGFTAFAASVAINGTIIIGLVKQLIGLIPYAAQQIGLGIIVLAQTLANAYPVWLNAMMRVLQALLNAINTMAPQIVQTLWNLIMLMASTLQSNVPVLVEKGLQLLLGILRGIRDNIQQIVQVAGEIIVNFINGISNQLPAIVDSGYNLIITFVESLADTIRNNQSRMDSAGKDLASAIVAGMTSGLRNGVSAVTSAAKEVASNALSGAKSFLGIKSPSREFMKVGKWSDEGFAAGLTRHAGMVEKSSADVGEGALGAIRNSMRSISSLVNNEMDANPTIRPVLDLSSVRQGVNSLPGMLGGKSFSVDANYSSASSIAGTQADSSTVLGKTVGASGSSSGDVNFYQNNYSPKALSRVEIYRNTRNQLASARGAVNARANGH